MEIGGERERTRIESGESGHGLRAESAEHKLEGKSRGKARGHSTGGKSAVETLRRPCRTGLTKIIIGITTGARAPDTALSVPLTGVVACRRMIGRDNTHLACAALGKAPSHRSWIARILEAACRDLCDRKDLELPLPFCRSIGIF